MESVGGGGNTEADPPVEAGQVKPRKFPRWVRNASHARGLRRLSYRPACPAKTSTFGKALHWLYPWRCWEYPPIHSACNLILPNKTKRTYENYRTGRYAVPEDVIEALLNEVRRVVDEGLIHISVLENDLAERRAQSAPTRLMSWAADGGLRGNRRPAPEDL